MADSKKLSQGNDMKKLIQGDVDMEGWLHKWTNYLRGYQRRWFVLSNGLLSYYRSQVEMERACRGTISLHGAIIQTVDSCTFIISNGGTQTFHIKAEDEVERQHWVTALELAKAKAMRAIESENDDNNGDSTKIEVTTVIRTLSSKLEDLRTCNDLIVKHRSALQRSLSELESLEKDFISDISTKAKKDNVTDISIKIKSVNERATLFRITANAMVNACSSYLELAQSSGRKWQRMLQHERERRIELEQMVEQLAREQTALEQTNKSSSNSAPAQDGISSEDDENTEFYDAQCGDVQESSNYKLSHSDSLSNTQVFDKIVNEELAADDGSSSDVDDITESAAILTAAIRSSATIKNKTSKSDRDSNGRLNNKHDILTSKEEGLPVLPENAKIILEEIRRNPLKKGVSRRTRIPDKPNHPLHIWSIMKNCIGKDLSKIPMPVNFSEPLSMLQRLTEDFEYSSILDLASKCEDPFERLARIAAFTISSYSTTANRTGKPFNPLLGETYECDRFTDLGWRAVSEQVSHHPPIAVQHCEGRKWMSWQEFTMASKFRGKYLQLIPTGTSHLKFTDTDDYYTWSKVTTTVHNIIVGKLWVDQEGEMDIVNHKTGAKCRLTYMPYRYFSRDQPRKVKGTVKDDTGEAKYVINGTWDNKIEIAPVVGVNDNGSFQTGEFIQVWQRILPPPDSEKYYNFTELACQLNEMESGIPPTDSRLRPDQRLMEMGMWDEANIEKLRLEEKQRQKRKERNPHFEEAIENRKENFSSFDDAKCDEKYSDCLSSQQQQQQQQRSPDLEDASESGDSIGYEPVWFKREVDPVTGDVRYIYGAEYWCCKTKQDWSRCPNIF